MPEKPNAPYTAPALTEVLADLLERAVKVVTPPKPKPPKSNTVRSTK
jgi:hypothetical protein